MKKETMKLDILDLTLSFLILTFLVIGLSSSPAFAQDADGDLIPDIADPDDDNDGIPDLVEMLLL